MFYTCYPPRIYPLHARSFLDINKAVSQSNGFLWHLYLIYFQKNARKDERR